MWGGRPRYLWGMSRRISKARLTPGPPSCDTVSSKDADAEGLATSQRLSSGSCLAMSQRVSGSVYGSVAVAGVARNGGFGG